jgi:hypothetical protein
LRDTPFHGRVSGLPGFGRNASEHCPFFGLEGDNAMIEVRPSDGVCRSCGGILHVIDADDATMVVECDDCGEGYTVEPDAFGDGGIEYWPAMMSELEGGE